MQVQRGTILYYWVTKLVYQNKISTAHRARVLQYAPMEYFLEENHLQPLVSLHPCTLFNKVLGHSIKPSISFPLPLPVLEVFWHLIILF